MKCKYAVNDNIFENESEISFYLAGFLAADGCIHSDNDLSIRLSSNDRQHLIKLNDAFESTCPVS